MAKNTQLAQASTVAMLEALRVLPDAGTGTTEGKLRIYNGTQPATADTAVTSQTLLVEIDLANPSFGSSTNDNQDAQSVAQGVPLQGTAVATGTASWFRVIDRDGNEVVDGSVGTSNADLVIDNLSITTSQIVQVNSYTLTMPGQ